MVWYCSKIIIFSKDGAGADGADPPPVSKCMVWTEQEACVQQVTQIGTSACGVTAVINALVIIIHTGRFIFDSWQKIN
jgi:hypothetical protein